MREDDFRQRLLREAPDACILGMHFCEVATSSACVLGNSAVPDNVRNQSQQVHWAGELAAAMYEACHTRNPKGSSVSEVLLCAGLSKLANNDAEGLLRIYLAVADRPATLPLHRL